MGDDARHRSRRTGAPRLADAGISALALAGTARDHALVAPMLVLDEVRTERLIGRPPHRADAARIEAIYGEPEVARWAVPGGRPLHLDGASAMIDRDLAHWRAHGFGRWVWFATDTSRLVARCGPTLMLVDGRPELELHWAVLPDVHRQGLATEAAEAASEVCLQMLGTESVVAFAHEGNTPSHGVMTAAGFRFERTFELDGEPHLLCRRARTS
jgi:ribosomal-protein-alanine N-acetyltransferase